MADNILKVYSRFTKLVSASTSINQSARADEIYRDIIRTPHKFVISNEVYTSINALSKIDNDVEIDIELQEKPFHNIKKLLDGMHDKVRLPFSTIWVERETPFRSIAKNGEGVGYLLSERKSGDDYFILMVSAGYDEFGWAFIGGSTHIFGFKNGELTACRTDSATGELIGGFYVTDELHVLVAIALMNNEKLISCQQSNMITTLGTSKKKPKKSGVIKVSLSSAMRKNIRDDAEMEKEATRVGVMAHFVRGHFKVKPNGVYWWSAFIRGSGNPIAKPYKLKS